MDNHTNSNQGYVTDNHQNIIGFVRKSGYMISLGLLAGFFSTLLATLIGVGVAFWNDRKIEEVEKHDKTIRHLESIEQELEQNRDTVNHSIDIIKNLQDSDGGNSSHYAIDLLATEAWEAAIDDGLIETIENDLYEDLHDIYYRTKVTNELIRRLRTESIHPSIGERQEVGPLQVEVWTISVTYWNEDVESIQEAELATVIKNRMNSVGIRIDSVLDETPETRAHLTKKKTEVENLSFRRITKYFDQYEEQE